MGGTGEVGSIFSACLVIGSEVMVSLRSCRNECYWTRCSEGHYIAQRTVTAVRSNTHVSLVFPAYTYIHTHLSSDKKKAKSAQTLVLP